MLAPGTGLGEAFLIWDGQEYIACASEGGHADFAPTNQIQAGLWAFLRTYRVWRSEGTWWGWHGAGWFLLTLMIVTVSMSVPAIAGPVLAP